MALTSQDLARPDEEDGHRATLESVGAIVIGSGDRPTEVCRSCHREIADPDDLASVNPPICATCYSV